MAKAPKRESESRYGSWLAITMLRELEASTELCDACGIDELMPETRTTPQDNIVLRYLEKSREHSPEAVARFCAVLSDFVSECTEGMVPNAGMYSKGLKIRVSKPSSKDNERLRTWKLISRITGDDYGPMPPDFGTPEWAEKQREARK